MILRNLTKSVIAAKGPVSKILLGIILMIMFSPTVFAQVSCGDLNQETPEIQKKMEGYIITILEEEIGSSSTTDSVTPSENASESLTCFRKTTCEGPKTGDSETDQKITCTSKYAETCTPGENVFCQRVQVLISQSGIDLLMSYLGIIYRWAASVIGIVSVAYLIYGGFLIGTAQDDTSKIDKAKEKIFQSIAGLVLLFLSAVILYTINPNFFTI